MRVTTAGSCLFFSTIALSDELACYVKQFMLTGAFRCLYYKQMYGSVCVCVCVCVYVCVVCMCVCVCVWYVCVCGVYVCACVRVSVCVVCMYV